MDMDALTIINSLAQAENTYAWFEQQAAPQTVLAVRGCAVPVRFDKGLAMHILQSPALGLNGNSPQMLAEIARQPFVHRRPDGTYKYAPPARQYFDERLRNDGVNYAELNRTIAEYLARERKVRLAKGLASDSHPVRDLALREAFHTIPADGKLGMDKLQDFVEGARGPDTLADTLAAVRICEYQRPYIPHERLVDAWYFEGRYHYFRHDYAAALPLLERVRNSGQRTRSVATADHFLGVIYRDQRRRHEAAEVLEESVQIDRELEAWEHVAHVLNTLGTVYRDQRRLDEATQALEEARDISESPNDRASKAMALNTLGTVYRHQRRLDEATQALEEARDIFEGLNDRSSKAIVLNTLGTVYRDRGQLEESERVLLKSRDILKQLGNERGVAMVCYSLGQLYESVGRLAEARAAYARSAEINIAVGLHYFAHKMQALAQHLDRRLQERERAKPTPPPERDINERLQALAKHVRGYPKDAQNRARYVALLKKAGQAEEALTVAREGWALTPADLWLYNSYISVLIKLRRWEEAAQVVRYRLELDTDAIENWLTMGLIQERLAEMGQGELEQCQAVVATYHRIIGSDEADQTHKARAWNGLGNILKELGDLEEAHDCYLQAQELGLRESQVLNNLGLLYIRMAESLRPEENEQKAEQYLARAEDAFLRAVDLVESPEEFVWPFMNLAELCLARDDWREAEDWLRQIDISFPDARQDDNVRINLEVLWQQLQTDNAGDS